VKRPELLNATQAELDELLRLAKTKTAFSAEHYELLERVLGTFVFVMLSRQSAKTSIKRFRQMLCGARTESKSNVLKDHGASADAPQVAQGQADGQAQAKPSPPGHGRNGAQAYRDAPVVEVDVPGLQPGDPCPECATGKVYDSPPKVLVNVVGQPAVGGQGLQAATVALPALRCRLHRTIARRREPGQVRPQLREHAGLAALRQRDAVLPPGEPAGQPERPAV
jgi:hypothetical protein